MWTRAADSILRARSIKWSNNKCLDLTNGVQTTGNQVQIWDCNTNEDNNNQIWDAGYMCVLLSPALRDRAQRY